MSHPNREIARRFVEALFKGAIGDDLLTPDMTAWTTLGSRDKASFQGAAMPNIPGTDETDAPGADVARAIFSDYSQTIDALTAEGDRVVAEVTARGTFHDGEIYENTYVFVMQIRDGRVAWLAEHFNPIPVMEKMFPRMQPPGA